MSAECAEQLVKPRFDAAHRAVIDANLALIRQETEAHASKEESHGEVQSPAA